MKSINNNSQNNKINDSKHKYTCKKPSKRINIKTRRKNRIELQVSQSHVQNSYVKKSHEQLHVKKSHVR